MFTGTLYSIHNEKFIILLSQSRVAIQYWLSLRLLIEHSAVLKISTNLNTTCSHIHWAQTNKSTDISKYTSLKLCVFKWNILFLFYIFQTTIFQIFFRIFIDELLHWGHTYNFGSALCNDIYNQIQGEVSLLQYDVTNDTFLQNSIFQYIHIIFTHREYHIGIFEYYRLVFQYLKLSLSLSSVWNIFDTVWWETRINWATF